MNKLNITLVFVLLFSFHFLTAQNNKQQHDDNSNHHHGKHHSDARFSFMTFGGIGYVVVDNDKQPNYNLNSSSAEFLLNYRIGKRYGIATGVGINQLSGNGFNAVGNFYHERGLLKIPVLFSVNYNLSHKVRLIANIGLYGQTILKDEYNFVGGTVEDVYEGWNFGFQSGVGLAYNFNHKISLGVMFNSQGDFTKLDSDPTKGVEDEQKLSGINSIGLLFGINL
ncbi:hypothetical protein [Kordia sp.]|uniref:hypothetical protein n=1 Tax=Kordia sp. TaxID=1965332 RepID=UPI003D2DFF5F